VTEVSQALERAAKLPCWRGSVTPQPLEGGITNLNFVVQDQGRKFFVRTGEDIPVHGVMRFNELAAARAADAAGLSPPVVYQELGVLVLGFIEGKTLAPEDVRSEENLPRVLELIQTCHREMPKHFRGPALIFWVFQVVRDYANSLRDGDSRCVPMIPELLSKAEELEESVGPVRIVFGHNDLLAGNFIDDGDRLWLIDWDYAGFNSPLFDLANVASNNELSSAQVDWLLEAYFGAAPDDEMRHRFRAMACASLLRETMWSMVSEIHSTLDFDYVAYTQENLERFERSFNEFRK